MMENQTIHVRITQEAIEAWSRTDEHPLTDILKDVTHTNWRAVDSIMLVEKVPPFRSVYVNSALLLELHDCKSRGQSAAFDCELELRSPFTCSFS